jgi:hypothetical protein
MARRRFQPFSAEELLELWEGLVYDDGLRYYPEPKTVEWQLAQEVEHEWSLRIPPALGRDYPLEQARRDRDALGGRLPFTELRRP